METKTVAQIYAEIQERQSAMPERRGVAGEMVVPPGETTAAKG